MEIWRLRYATLNADDIDKTRVSPLKQKKYAQSKRQMEGWLDFEDLIYVTKVLSDL